MGAESFMDIIEGSTAETAFKTAVRAARFEYGNRGYTGTIAEKNEFEMATYEVINEDVVGDFVDKMYDEDRFLDKFGPAGCVKIGDQKWLFFGSAPC